MQSAALFKSAMDFILKYEKDDYVVLDLPEIRGVPKKDHAKLVIVVMQVSPGSSWHFPGTYMEARESYNN